MDLRRIEIADHAAVASLLDRRTMLLRWLVAFFRHQDCFPEEEEGYWSLWRDAGPAGEEPACVVAHFFQTASAYVCAGPRADLRAIEALCNEELLPERIFADAELVDRWRAASGIFERAETAREIDVLASSPVAAASEAAPPGFRSARPEDIPILEEFGRLFAVEAGEDFIRDFDSLVDHGLVFVIEGEGRILGYVRSNLSDGRYVHAGGLYVHPLHRGKGVGRGLARGLARQVASMEEAAVVLDVNRDNVAARSAYAAAGYKKVGEGLVARFGGDAWRG